VKKLAEALTTCDLFAGLAPLSLEILARTCTRKSVARQEFLFFEGDPASAVYLLRSGRIRLTKASLGGREVVIKIVSPGEVFAEAVLFEMSTYPVSAQAVADSGLYRLPKEAFLRLFDEPAFARDYAAALAQRLRYLTGRILSLTTSDVESRLATFLEEHGGWQERRSMPLSKKEVAAAIDTTPETLSRLLRRLAKEDLLHWEGNTLTLPKGRWIPRRS